MKPRCGTPSAAEEEKLDAANKEKYHRHEELLSRSFDATQRIQGRRQRGQAWAARMTLAAPHRP